jgi:hypothetical protein
MIAQSTNEEFAASTERATVRRVVDGPTLDSVGEVLPRHLRPAFRISPAFDKFRRQVEAIRSHSRVCAPLQPEISQGFSTDVLILVVRDLLRESQLEIPFALCPSCGGINSDTCPTCDGAGYLSRSAAELLR